MYDRPTWQLMIEAVDEMAPVFTNHEMMDWFQKRYPDLKEMTIRLHLRALSANVPPSQNSSRWPAERRILYKLDRTHYTRYDSAIHGVFEHGLPIGADDLELDELDDDLPMASSGSGEFALEAHLEEFMAANWSRLNFGVPLTPTIDEGTTGRQFQTDIGRIDFLCTNTSTGDFWVLELKRGRSSDRVVGQVLRYMGWVKEHLAGEKQVHGLIISHESDRQLTYALQMVSNVQAWTYEVSFSFNREAVPA